MEITRGEVLGLDAATYAAHWLHVQDRTWIESNCYVDLWIEVLHALHLDPLACMAFTLAMDFEGDQWTFFKPPLADLAWLYGIDVQELNVWRSLVQHTLEQISLGRLVVSEVDAYFLPDTAGTTYHSEHSKTSIAIESVDTAMQRMGYFHGATYHSLSGGDFEGLFRLNVSRPQATGLEPYVELVKLDAVCRLPPAELLTRSLSLLRNHLVRRPELNPVRRYQQRLAEDVGWLGNQDLETYHRYAFATLRQLGGSQELAALYLHWLSEQGHDDLEPAWAALESLSSSARGLQLKLARVVSGRNVGDLGALFDSMASAWDQAGQLLGERYLAIGHPV